jgi:soluble lytic murein transglycosylase-like protein
VILLFFAYLSWFNDDYLFWIQKHCVADPKLVLSIIQVESSGNPKALGKLVNIRLIRKGNYVIEKHRAYGLMQVMSFHERDPIKLFDPEYNIYKGCSILHDCIRKSRSFIKSISCYHDGPNSKKINYSYVKKVLKVYENLSK